MNQFLLNADAACGVLLKVAAIFALAALGRWLLRLPRAQAAHFWIPSEGRTRTNSTGGPGYRFRLDPAPRTATPVEPEPAPVPAAVSTTPVIVCGNCQAEIKSAPVGSHQNGNVSVTQYVCQNCGMTCQVAL
jgi:hypothetical protein